MCNRASVHTCISAIPVGGFCLGISPGSPRPFPKRVARNEMESGYTEWNGKVLTLLTEPQGIIKK